MQNYILIAYFLWKYYYLFEYGYSIFYYTNKIRKILFHNKVRKRKQIDDWILIDD